MKNFNIHENDLGERDLEFKLLIPDFHGNHNPEYIPPNYNKLRHSALDKYMHLRDFQGLDIYYWQVRHWLYPIDRKMYDVNFIQHVLQEHDGTPEDNLEKVHYFKARTLYSAEMELIKHISGIGLEDQSEKDVYLFKHPYMKAYKEKWFEPFDEGPQWDILYHGINYIDLESYFEMLNTKFNKRVNILKDRTSNRKKHK